MSAATTPYAFHSQQRSLDRWEGEALPNDRAAFVIVFGGAIGSAKGYFASLCVHGASQQMCEVPAQYGSCVDGYHEDLQTTVWRVTYETFSPGRLPAGSTYAGELGPVGQGQCLDEDFVVDDRGVEGALGSRTQLATDQVGGFGDHHRGGDQWTGLGLEQPAAGTVVRVAAISSGQQRTGIHDQHSVAPKSVGQHRIAVSSTGGREGSTDGCETQPTDRLPWFAVGCVRPGETCSDQFDGDLVYPDTTPGSGRSQSTSQFVGEVHGDRHLNNDTSRRHS